MMNGEFLPPALLKRKAVVYIRQSTPLQVQVNLESQGASTSLSMRLDDMDSGMSKSSTTTLAARQAEQ
jgi:hypothetical protein